MSASDVAGLDCDAGPDAAFGAQPGAPLDAQDRHRRECTELLRRQAQRKGLLAADDRAGADGVVSEAAAVAIEALLERELEVVEPDDEACRRYHAAHASRFGAGERVHVRHILFAVTPGVDVAALAAYAEQLLLGLRCASDRASAFAQAARRNSNCPSGAQGGELGWIVARDCAPEFAREVFDRPETGLLPRLVRTRFGLHIVDVLARENGEELPWEEVREAVEQELRRRSWVTALRRYLDGLLARAGIESS
jgi:peptidyl-prolyl cis-trans isomerase C